MKKTVILLFTIWFSLNLVFAQTVNYKILEDETRDIHTNLLYGASFFVGGPHDKISDELLMTGSAAFAAGVSFAWDINSMWSWYSEFNSDLISAALINDYSTTLFVNPTTFTNYLIFHISDNSSTTKTKITMYNERNGNYITTNYINVDAERRDIFAVRLGKELRYANNAFSVDPLEGVSIGIMGTDYQDVEIETAEYGKKTKHTLGRFYLDFIFPGPIEALSYMNYGGRAGMLFINTEFLFQVEADFRFIETSTKTDGGISLKLLFGLPVY